MKCRECKEVIILNGEVTASEREQMEAHRKECSDCQRHYAEVQQFSNVIRLASGATPAYENSVSLTDSIIRKVKQEPSYNNQVKWSFFEFLDYARTRYALASVSLFLVVFFMMEIGYTPIHSTKEPKLHAKYVTLESKALRESFKKRDEKEKPFFLVSCIAEGTRKVDLKCLKSRMNTSNF